MLSRKKYNNQTIIKRVNITDISEFNKKNKCYKSEVTKYNILSLLRSLARKLNGEPKLNFRNNLKPPKKTKINPKISKNCIIKLASCFRENKDIESLLILYLLHYAGLNFYMIARILIKDFKLSFKSLILSKGTKKRVHNFPEYISSLFFDYFKISRTYKSKYFFFDNYLGNEKKSRGKYIKDKFVSSINN